jgi:hypothetical protein
MSYFQLYEKQRELKSKLQIDSHWRWRGPVRIYNEITVVAITPTTVYYHYTDTPELKSSTDIETYYHYTDTPELKSSTDIGTFMRKAVYLGPVVEPAH